MSMQEQSASLACVEGGSDKVYAAQLVKSGDGWLVLAQYGPRGGTLKSADKHSTPVAYEVAEKSFNSLVQSKLAKGYVPSAAVGDTRMTAAPTVAEFTDLRPQLLNPIAQDEVNGYLNDSRFCCEVKADGERRLLVLNGADIYGVNRKGQRVALLETIANHAAELPVGRDGRTVLDGEQVGDTLHVWDVLLCDGVSLVDWPLNERQDHLVRLFKGSPPDAPIVLTETAVGPYAKMDLLDRVVAEGREGVVFKRITSRYTPGRPASGGDWLKHKLVKSATVRVKSHNAGKASIAVEIKDGENWTFVGNVTVPPNQKRPDVGEIVEVHYLYVSTVGGCLFQPVLLGYRTDLSESDCGIEQLQYKGVGSKAA